MNRLGWTYNRLQNIFYEMSRGGYLVYEGGKDQIWLVEVQLLQDRMSKEGDELDDFSRQIHARLLQQGKSEVSHLDYVSGREGA